MADIKNQKSAAVNTEETLNSSEMAFLKYRKAIIAGVIAVIVIIAGIVVYNTYVKGPREDKANTAIAKGQDYFAAEQFDKALNGDGAGYPGFVSVAADYSGTDAGNLANLYAGLCYAHLDKWTEAAAYIEKYDGQGDQMISPAAIGALGNAYAHLKQLDKAVDLLKKAAKTADNNTLSPLYLIQAGEILEKQGKKDEALKLYQEIKEKYFNSMQYQTIDKYIERATTK
mgnify:FL=1|jgi:tetratricopeptide (TPR) repeat protein